MNKIKTMKTLQLLIIALFTAFTAICCQNNSKHTSDFNELQRSLVSPDSTLMKNDNEPSVYYFHFTRRCATCNAIESITVDALKEYYGDKVKFTSLNLDEEDAKTVAKSMKVNGQSLIIKNNKKVIDLTNEAFMNALSDPDKLKSKLKATIDPLL